MADRVWLAYDLGVDGDYEGLYQWLDQHHAVECGDSCASLLYDAGRRALDNAVLSDLRKAVSLRSRDRLYLISRKEGGKWTGRFILGGRKGAPWAGYAATGGAAADEE